MKIINFENIKKVMVFSAHPDDEIIGPGGTLHKLSSEGKEISIVSFTLGGTAAKSYREIKKMQETRKKELRKTDSILGTKNRIILKIPPQQVYREVFGNNQLHHKLIQLIRKYKPDILFSHYADLHRDHNAIFQATKEVVFHAAEEILLNLGKPWKIPIVLFYFIEKRINANVISELQEENLNAKLDALSTQISQTRINYLERLKQMIDSRAKEAGARYVGYGKFAEEFYIHTDYPILIQ